MDARTTEERIKALRSVPMFQDLPDASLARILEKGTEFEAPAGVVLVEAKREGSGLFVIEEGIVSVEAGERRFEKGPGEFFGELALLTESSVRSARVRAKTAVRCLAINRQDFRELLHAEPTVAVHMLEALAAMIATEASH